MKLSRRSLFKAIGAVAALPVFGAAAFRPTVEDIIQVPIYDGEKFLYVIEDDNIEFGFGTYGPKPQTLNRLT